MKNKKNARKWHIPSIIEALNSAKVRFDLFLRQNVRLDALHLWCMRKDAQMFTCIVVCIGTLAYPGFDKA